MPMNISPSERNKTSKLKSTVNLLKSVGLTVSPSKASQLASQSQPIGWSVQIKSVKVSLLVCEPVKVKVSGV
jgi:hypothetical protein